MTSLKTQQIEIPHFLPECPVQAGLPECVIQAGLPDCVVQAGVRNDMSLFVKEACKKVRRSRTFLHAFPIMNTCHFEWSLGGMRNLLFLSQNTF
jgi:hypothetical protein